MNNILLKAENISKIFNDGDNSLEILKCLNLELAIGEKIAILGQSGSGKSTLLHILAGLDDPSSGKVKFNNKIIGSLSQNQRAQLRNNNIGFIFQFHHLLPEFTALENIAMPLLIAGSEFDDAMEQASNYLKKVKLEQRADHKPSALSGGERQRIAIARAMINQPKCILADEPTGNLDEYNAENIFELLLELNSEVNTSMILVTHDKSLSAKLDKTYVLNNGKLTA
jgi:lipoprotein-releasing system ATP-binding protein